MRLKLIIRCAWFDEAMFDVALNLDVFVSMWLLAMYEVDAMRWL